MGRRESQGVWAVSKVQLWPKGEWHLTDTLTVHSENMKLKLKIISRAPNFQNDFKRVGFFKRCKTLARPQIDAMMPFTLLVVGSPG